MNPRVAHILRVVKSFEALGIGARSERKRNRDHDGGASTLNYSSENRHCQNGNVTMDVLQRGKHEHRDKLEEGPHQEGERPTESRNAHSRDRETTAQIGERINSEDD